MTEAMIAPAPEPTPDTSADDAAALDAAIDALPEDERAAVRSGIALLAKKELAQARVSQATLDRVKLALRADAPDIEAVAPYWYLREFDESGLQALASLRAVCGVLGFADRLKAAYTGATGDLIEVRFEPVASPDGLSQAFRVMEIRRYADPRTPPQQLKVLGEHLAEQYADFSRYANSTQPGAGWIDDGQAPPHLRLLAPTGDAVDNSLRLRQHPECSGN